MTSRVLAAAAGATVLAVALTGCGSKAKATAAKPTASHTPKTSHTATTSATPTPEETPTEATYAPGDTVMSTDDLTAACDQGFGGTAATFGDSSADTTSSAEEDVLQIRQSGVVLVQCTMDSDVKLVAVDARAHAVLWNIDLAQGGDNSDDTNGVLEGGSAHVYLVTVTDHPADGLQAEYFTRTVTALDEQTGTQVWTQPLEPNDKESYNPSGNVNEGPTADEAATVALVNVDDYSAFDANAGTPLWRVPELDPMDRFDDSTYAAFGRTMSTTWNNNDNVLLNGVDLGTGKIEWTSPADTMASSGSGEPWGMDGESMWWIYEGGYDAWDVKTGEHTAHGVIPTSFQNPLVTPKYTVALVDTSLRAFHTGDWARPLWSVDATSAEPEVVTDESVVVNADSGTLLLDMGDGSTISEGDESDYTAGEPPVDGLSLNGYGDIIELGKTS